MRGLTACSNETSWRHECGATAPVAPRNRRTAERSLQRFSAARRAGKKDQLMTGLRAVGHRADRARLHSVDCGDNTRERDDWVSEALCLTVDPDELFVEGADQLKATAICRRCPVLYQCGAEALDNKVEFGVWGGMTERERRAMLKKHPEVVSWSALFDELKARNVSLKEFKCGRKAGSIALDWVVAQL
jgi:WhiB family redox-sensing transcriptional regulator